MGLIFGTVAAAAQTARSYGPIAPGESWQDIAAEVQALYPELTRSQVATALRKANMDQYGMGAQPTRGSAVILPHPVVVRQMLGLRPPPPSVAKTELPAKQAERTQIPEPPGKQDIVAQQSSDLPAPSSNASDEYFALAQLLETHAGDPEFDYRFGVAAMDVGEYSQAVLALQRVVWGDPEFAGARFDLARAHIALEDYDTARIELDRVAQSDPPPAVANAVALYLARIDQLETAAAPRSFDGSVGVFAGYDSNANAATADTTFLGIALDADSRTTESPYYGLEGKFNHRYALGERTALISRLSGRTQQFPDAQFVDSTDIRGSVGLRTTKGSWRWSTSVGAHFATIDDSYNNRGARVEGGLGWVGDRLRVDVTGRAGLLRFPDRLAVQSVDQTTGGITVSFLPTTRSLLSITGLVGEDDANQSGSPYSRDLAGGRVRYNLLMGQNELRLSANYLDSNYDGLFFGGTRQDEQSSVAIALFCRGLTRNFSLVPRLRYIDNQSTVQLFDYNRTDASLTLQHDF